ncbi:MAG: phytanoyl-CoA dioxygenase family protein [Planctomycetota bacterium]
MPAALASVSPTDLDFYKDQGYVLLRGVLPTDLLETAQSLCEQWVDDEARAWRDRGLITDLKEDLPFDRRFYTLWQDAGEPHHHRSPRGELVKLDPKTTFKMLSHPALLDAACALLETDELVTHGVWNMRPKCPGANFTNTPLHQDAQYFPPQARTRVMSAWFPLHEVDASRSCLEVVPGFKADHLFDADESSGTGFIGIRPNESKDMNRVPIAMQPGDLLCFTDLTPHGATGNATDLMRWSIDLRFVPAETAHPDAYAQGHLSRSPDPERIDSYDTWVKKWQTKAEW